MDTPANSDRHKSERDIRLRIEGIGYLVSMANIVYFAENAKHFK